MAVLLAARSSPSPSLLPILAASAAAAALPLLLSPILICGVEAGTAATPAAFAFAGGGGGPFPSAAFYSAAATRRASSPSKPLRSEPHSPLFSSLTTAGEETTLSSEETEEEVRLMKLAKTFKLEVWDMDEGIFGLDSKDNRYGIEVVRTELSVDGGMGLVLTEMAGSPDGRGLVLVSEVSGNALDASPHPIKVGDCITGVMTSDGDNRDGGRHRMFERTVGLNYDGTVEAIGAVKEAVAAAGGGDKIVLELNRLVERARVSVEIDDEEGNRIQTIEALAGENLRRLLLRKGIKLYDQDTKRFDMPFATGDCAGEGLCGTCLVAVREGMDLLNDRHPDEDLITRGRPASWRASCRAVVGADNKPGTVKVQVRPQSGYADELNPGVRKLG